MFYVQLHRKEPWVPKPGGVSKELKFVNWTTGKEVFQDDEKDRLQARVVVHLIFKLTVTHCMPNMLAASVQPRLLTTFASCGAGGLRTRQHGR